MTTSRADLSQGTDPAGHPARREPLLWLQLLGLAVLPLEAVLLVLLLGGADPGPFPGLERLLAWALGGLGSAFLFWRLPPDLWSLLLLQVPLRGRRPVQLRLSALQAQLPLRLVTSAGAALLLPLLWWADAAAGLAWSWSPLAGSSRLIGLLAAAALLALMQWQWHQAVQTLWLFSRPPEQVASTVPLSQDEAADQRLSLGLPLLLLAPLRADPQPEDRPGQTSGVPSEQPSPASSPASPAPSSGEGEPIESPPAAPPDSAALTAPARPPVPEIGDGDRAAAIPPEQQAEQPQGGDLDQQV